MTVSKQVVLAMCQVAFGNAPRVFCYMRSDFANFSVFFVNNQLDAQFFFHVCLFLFFTCFGQPCAHHQEN